MEGDNSVVMVDLSDWEERRSAEPPYGFRRSKQPRRPRRLPQRGREKRQPFQAEGHSPLSVVLSKENERLPVMRVRIRVISPARGNLPQLVLCAGGHFESPACDLRILAGPARAGVRLSSLAEISKMDHGGRRIPRSHQR